MSAIARKERSRSRSVRVGALTLAGAAAVTAFALTAQNGMPDYVPGVSRTSVEVQFEDVGALRAGDDPTLRAALQPLIEHPSPIVREHAAWALAQGAPAHG